MTPKTGYSHLIGGANPNLEVASCLYFDGIRLDFSILRMLDLVEEWFETHGHRPKVLLARGSSDSRVPRYTIKTLREAATDANRLQAIKTMQFFPKGRTTIDATWRPAVYFAVSMERPESAFFSTNMTMNQSSALEMLRHGDTVFSSCAAYSFPFPERFSPLGYYWGISVEPAGRDIGSWDQRKSHRLSHWRDNTQIGIQHESARRMYGACDGYVRDTFPIMLLSPQHMARPVGSNTLLEEIKQRQLGVITPEGDKFVWTIPTEKLAEVQHLLDVHDISQSGRRLEMPQAAGLI